MTFGAAVRTCLRKYATFSGRASRSEYWWFVLFLLLGAIGLALVDGAVFGTTMVEVSPGQFAVDSDGPLAALFSLATLLPALAAGWRRMHDTGRSGLYLFYPLIAMVGLGGTMTFFGGLGMLGDQGVSTLAALVMVPAMLVLAISPLVVLWWLTRPSQPAVNAYGPPPVSVSRSREVPQ